METQEFQKIVLDKFNTIENKFTTIESDLKDIRKDIHDLDARLSSRISDLDTRLSNRISEVEKSLAIFEARDAEKSKINAWLSKLFLIVIGGAIAILGRLLIP